jgi:4,5-dihydroxyphthalate decarboxylase
VALHVAVGRRSYTRAMITGDVTITGVPLEVDQVAVVNKAFRSMVRELAFDVSEMSFATYLAALERGVPLVGLPVFLMRGLAHPAMVRASDGPVHGPHDLRGRRVGTHNGYTATTGVWAREVLASEYGVPASSVIWVRAGDEHVADYQPPTNVIPMEERRPLAEALRAGDLPAAVGAEISGDGVEPLIEDADAVAMRALSEHGFYPLNHLVVVRSDLLAENPDLAAQLCDAFRRSKALWLDQLRHDRIPEPTSGDVLLRRVMDSTGDDPLPYGVQPNRPMLDRLLRAALDQGVSTRPITVEALFAPGTLDFVG